MFGFYQMCEKCHFCTVTLANFTYVHFRSADGSCRLRLDSTSRTASTAQRSPSLLSSRAPHSVWPLVLSSIDLLSALRGNPCCHHVVHEVILGPPMSRTYGAPGNTTCVWDCAFHATYIVHSLH